MVNVVSIPRSDWNQVDPHAHICLAFGNDVEGVFVPQYFQSHYFRDSEFAQFAALLGTLEGQTLEAIRQIKGLAGTVK